MREELGRDGGPVCADTASEYDTTSRQASDFDAIEALQAAASEAGWDLEYRQLKAGRLRARVALYECGGLLLDSEYVSLGMEVAGTTAPDAVAIAGTVRGEASVNGLPMERSPILMPPRCDATHFSASGLEAVTLVMSVPEFTALFGRGARRWLRTGRPTPLPGLTSDWLRQLAAGFRRGAREQIEEVVGHAARSASLPFGDERESTVRVRAKVVGRARGYIEAKLSQTIRMADVCRHAGASLRNLERFFAVELQMTPSRYIQARRLHEARRELLDPRLAHKAIGTIAYDAGFTHLGRFAGAFRARFGETPRNARAGIRSGPRGEPTW